MELSDLDTKIWGTSATLQLECMAGTPAVTAVRSALVLALKMNVRVVFSHSGKMVEISPNVVIDTILHAANL